MCAEDIAAQDVVCPHCGHVLRAVSAPPMLGAPPPVASSFIATTAPSSRPSVGRHYAVPLALTLATLVAGGVWVASRRSSSPAAAPSATSRATPTTPPATPPPTPARPSPAPLPATPPTRAPVATPVHSARTFERLQPTRFAASSFISNRRNQHAPARAFDGDPTTAWNENEPGPGDGSWIEATFPAAVLVERIQITTGWDSRSARHGDLFPLNSHLRRVRVSFDGGHRVERDIGEDERLLVLENLHVRARTIRIDALSVWPGTHWADLCVSEVVVEGTSPHSAEHGAESPAAQVPATPPAPVAVPRPSSNEGSVLVQNVPSETPPEPTQAPEEPAPEPSPPRREAPPAAEVEPHSVMAGWPCHADLECMGSGFCSRAQGGLCSQRCETVSDCTSGFCIRGECWRPCHASPCEGARCIHAQDDNGLDVQVCRR